MEFGEDMAGPSDVATDSDELLAHAAAIGDRAAFDELVRRTLPVLLRYANRMTPDRQNAEDVVQETLLAAWKGLPRFGFQSSFRTWVFSIAHRKIIDIRRKRSELAADDEFLSAVPSSSPTPVDDAMGTSLMDALERELADLPYNSRAAWWLREMEGLSHPEIARILQITPGSVRGHLQRTRARLAERMEPWRPGGTGNPTGVAEPRSAPIPRDAPAGGRGRTDVGARKHSRAGPVAARDTTERSVGT
ncbi:RNA polymerase sigma factor [Williamsia maris]|uniref:RNA polymerase sigma-70 factor, ECF subfamily n=1 Tax=Williamsia maris TaxID=72806 RepID=A0ABT1HDV6_9NOCA|nr:sigma-70 family RNA polymerase sigma factor [Williamsia maris]MCP2175863.1 RNA polymerase sigma-70 factor, ECF subfamily [Williamsia maris]